MPQEVQLETFLGKGVGVVDGQPAHVGTASVGLAAVDVAPYGQYAVDVVGRR